MGVSLPDCLKMGRGISQFDDHTMTDEDTEATLSNAGNKKGFVSFPGHSFFAEQF